MMTQNSAGKPPQFNNIQTLYTFQSIHFHHQCRNSKQAIMHIPMRFSLAIENIARWYALRTSSSLTTSLIRFHLSGWSSHWYAFTATCVPRGLVSTNTSPTTALSGLPIRKSKIIRGKKWQSHSTAVQFKAKYFRPKNLVNVVIPFSCFVKRNFEQVWEREKKKPRQEVNLINNML